MEIRGKSVLAGQRLNFILSWVLIGYLALMSLPVYLNESLAWTVYLLAVIFLTVLPALGRCDPRNLPPFEIILLISVPFTLQGFDAGFVASHTLNYLSAASVSLLLVSELESITSFRTTPSFSVLLVALSTVAITGLWSVSRWLSDIFLGTGFIASEELLMWEFTAGVLSGIVSGTLFTIYFRLVGEVRK